MAGHVKRRWWYGEALRVIHDQAVGTRQLAQKTAATRHSASIWGRRASNATCS
jgi:hypothetical protein